MKLRKEFLSRIRWYVWQNMVAFDQQVNALRGGWADETISACCWRKREHWFWGKLRKLVDIIFRPFDGKNHCEMAYYNELHGMHKPGEYRRGM